MTETELFYRTLRGQMDPHMAITAAILTAETKAEYGHKDLTAEQAYDKMLVNAGKLHVFNPFTDAKQFFSAYLQLGPEPEWEELLYNCLENDRCGWILVSKPLMELMEAEIQGGETVLIAEGEKFVPYLKASVDANRTCRFTITTQNALVAKAISRTLERYENAVVLQTGIYRHGLSDKKFDRILAVPDFAGREYAQDEPGFLCRELDMVAFENLLRHLSSSGKISIVMPARITYAGGHINDLRKIVMTEYKLEQIAKLPEGIFRNTMVRNYLLKVAMGKTEDVIFRKYDAPGRMSKRSPVMRMEVAEEVVVTSDEIEKIGNWLIDKMLLQQNEEYAQYRASNREKIPLGEVAEIFRGKAVSKKDFDGEIRVVNISNIKQFELDYDSMDMLNAEERKVASYLLREGDVLLPARGTAIRTAVFHKQDYPCIASSNVIVIRPNAERLNGTYLKMFLDSPIGNRLVLGHQQGMSFMNISYTDLKMMEVPLPTIDVQNQIAEEYEKAYKDYIKRISEAEKRWSETLTRLRNF